MNDHIPAKPRHNTEFETLRLRIDFLNRSRYRVTCTDIDSKETHAEAFWPFTDEEELNWIEALNGELPGHGDRKKLLEQVGEQLFEALFHDKDAYAALGVARNSVRESQKVLRLVLELDHPRLERLPWESILDPTAAAFVARDPQICLIRRVRESAVEPVTIIKPLRILVVIPQPVGGVPLNVEREWAILNRALKEPLGNGQIELDPLPPIGRDDPVTLQMLERHLQLAEEANRPYHMLHFIGHAEWDAAAGAGVLWFEDYKRDSVAVSGEALGGVLTHDLQLVVLNACEGARNEQSAPFRSITTALLHSSDVVTVIASQIRLKDTVAHDFTRAFYQKIGQGYTLEEAMIAARAEIARIGEEPMSWAAPVMVTREPRLPIYPFLSLPPRRVMKRLYAGGLTAVTLLSGITVVTLIRVFGWLGGIAFQLAIWVAAATIFWLNRRFILEAWRETLLAVVTATAVIGLWFWWLPTVELPSQAEVQVQIEPPPDLVRGTVSVEGTVGNLPPDRQLWLLVQAEGSDSYVAGDLATLSEDRTQFDVPELRVGPPADRLVRGQRYIIQPVVVDDGADRQLTVFSQAFFRYFHPDLRVTPEPSLPHITVTRR
ncbi:MAG: CHAT domain-containing protein [Anaerolineales bacterium]|nr:CHAT domain-containing protein [Anaerolineales bacterium]